MKPFTEIRKKKGKNSNKSNELESNELEKDNAAFYVRLTYDCEMSWKGRFNYFHCWNRWTAPGENKIMAKRETERKTVNKRSKQYFTWIDLLLIELTKIEVVGIILFKSFQFDIMFNIKW